MSSSKSAIVTATEPEVIVDPVELDAAKEVALVNGADVYTHTFDPPFVWCGRTYETLTFDWASLTGADSLAIENEMAARGKMLVAAEFSGEYLTGMAARACTERDEKNRRVLGTDALKAMSLRDHQKICGRARSFLLHARS